MPRQLSREEFLKTKIFILTELANVQSSPLARNWYLNEANIMITGVVPRATKIMMQKVLPNLSVGVILRGFETKIKAIEALLHWNRKFRVI